MFTQDAQAGLDHIKNWKVREEARKASRANQPQRGDFESSYMQWEKGDQTVRFVGNFFTAGHHYIGNGGKLSYLKLFDDTAFDKKAEKHIGKKIVCANWDFEKSEHIWEGPCIICQLNNIARAIMRSPQYKTQSTDDQARWQALKSKTGVKTEHNWNAIARGKPDLKAYLMATLNNELFGSLMTSVHAKWEPRYFAGIEDGVDVCVNLAEAEGGKIKYSAALAINGVQVALSPLTDDEKSWALHNLADRFGPARVLDQNLIRSLLLPQWQTILPTEEEQKESAASAAPAVSADSSKKKKGPF